MPHRVDEAPVAFVERQGVFGGNPRISPVTGKFAQHRPLVDVEHHVLEELIEGQRTTGLC